MRIIREASAVSTSGRPSWQLMQWIMRRQGVGLGPFWWEASLKEEGIKWAGVNSAVGAKFEESFATVKLYVVEKFGAAQQGRPHTHLKLQSYFFGITAFSDLQKYTHMLPHPSRSARGYQRWRGVVVLSYCFSAAALKQLCQDMYLQKHLPASSEKSQELPIFSSSG